MGPNTRDPARMPKVIRRKRAPAWAMLTWYSVTTPGRSAPSVVSTMPNDSIPIHAIANTLFVRMYSGQGSCGAGPRSNPGAVHGQRARAVQTRVSAKCTRDELHLRDCDR